MYSSRRLPVLLLVVSSASFADGFMLGGGAESDNLGGLAVSIFGGAGIGEDTWLSAGYAQATVELYNGRDIDSRYADIELDHFFDPVGVRLGLAYWGDSDVLESDDWRASVYYRNKAVMLSFEYEYRDFEFTIPSVDFTTERSVMFDADGFGIAARFYTSEDTSIRLRGIKYDYSVPFRAIDNVDAARLLSVTRLSLINTLVNYRASLSLSIDQGLRNWGIDIATWESVLDESRTNSLTLRYLMPMSDRTDIEFGLGYDDSELYGSATFFSVYLFFYGS